MASPICESFDCISGLGLGHPVYTKGERTPPRSAQALAAFANYVKAAAKHFKGKRVAFEIWNEPNYHGFWEPTPSVKEYSELLRRGIAAIRAVDANATIMTGGLSGWSDAKWQYLAELIETKAVAGADFLGIHTYTEESENRKDVGKTCSAAGMLWKS